jgi:hypothetical protein
LARTIYNPRPGTKFPSPIEPSGWWTVPRDCLRVTLASVTDYPIDHVVDRHAARHARALRRATRP